MKPAKKISGTFSVLKVISLTVLLFISGCSRDEDNQLPGREILTAMLADEINADSLRSYVNWLSGMGTRFSLAGNHREVALAIRAKFIEKGYPGARLDSFEVSHTYKNVNYVQWQYNIIADIPGTRHPDSLCILGSHYDDILSSGDPFVSAPGANDNGSGVAAVIEVARVLMENDFRPSKTIRFIAFGDEEFGMLGSQHYAEVADFRNQKISMMLNNDMIAYEPSDDENGWIVDIKDYDNSHDLRARAEKMCRKYTILGYKNDNTYNQSSDSYPFAIRDYKAIFFFSDKMDLNYHSTADQPAACNFGYAREITAVSCALLVNYN